MKQPIVLRLLLACVFIATSVRAQPNSHPGAPKRPNIILIMTDDQGYGDLGFYGNPYLKTPNIDNFAAQSTRLTNFHTSPVCSPTRASLLTGRYHQRTGVHDTYNGGSIMATEEVTLAEILCQNGYQTNKSLYNALDDCYGPIEVPPPVCPFQVRSETSNLIGSLIAEPIAHHLPPTSTADLLAVQ